MIAGLLSFSFTKSNRRFFIHHIITIFLFAMAYFLASIYINESMVNKNAIKKHTNDNRSLSFLDCLYFSLVTQTTVGYGDIVPTHAVTKLINVMQLLTIYGILLIEL
jgi:hypothetical protein